jgi:hypothetical protein
MTIKTVTTVAILATLGVGLTACGDGDGDAAPAASVEDTAEAPTEPPTTEAPGTTEASTTDAPAPTEPSTTEAPTTTEAPAPPTTQPECREGSTRGAYETAETCKNGTWVDTPIKRPPTTVDEALVVKAEGPFWLDDGETWMHTVTVRNKSDRGVVDTYGSVTAFNADGAKVGEGYMSLFIPPKTTVETVVEMDVAKGQTPVSATYEVGSSEPLSDDLGTFTIEGIERADDEWSTSATVTVNSSYRTELTPSITLIAFVDGLPIGSALIYDAIPANNTAILTADFYQVDGPLPPNAEIKAYVG